MNPALVLVRHGQTDWNAAGRLQGRTDVPLNHVGRAQALDAAAMLSEGNWNMLVTSPMKRAVETAGIIGQQLRMDTTLEVDGLRERDYGGAEGRLTKDFKKEGLVDLEGMGELVRAEPEEAVAGRGIQALRSILQAYPDRRIIVVAHGTLIRLTLSALLGAPQPRVLNGQGIIVDLGLVLALP